MLPKYVARTLAALAILALSLPAWSQTVNTNNIQEDFTTSTTNFTWLSFNGACLTAGTGTDQQHLPGCLNDNYYQNQTQWGGQNGCLGTNLNSDGTCPSTQTADTSGNGALRLTNGNAGTASFSNGFNQNGAILSNFSFPVSNGIQITFKTVTYHGNSKGNGGGTGVDGHDGADGITFFLLDDSVVSQSWNTPLDSGAFGGSLGYTCSNTNNDPTVRSADSSVRGYDGIIGGYIGLGVDEFGNFLNPGDNTASGPGLQANRIGMRGAGSIAWKWLTNTYPNAYSSTWTTSQQATAVKNTCKSGYLMDYNGNYFTSPTTSNSTSKNQSNGVAVADYGMIKDAQGNGAYKVLTSTQLLALGGGIANESAATRSSANPIAYNVKITQDGKLSFSYAFGTGTWQPVITNVDISNSNGTIPRNVRFGFAGSDGGASNVHEILCFAAQPAETSGSSGGVNVYQNPTIKSNTQIFLANYFPSNWTGQLTAQTIGFNGTTVVANTTPSWDARCVLSGNDPSTGKCNSTNSTVSTVEDWQASDGRQILTWDPATKAPVAFEWSSFSTDEQGFYFGNNQDVLSFLRGDRTNEIGYVAADGSTGKNEFRTRVAVLGDIVDSSPTWVGPPQTYTNMDNWVDALYPPGSSAPATPPENSGQKYSEFQALYTAKQSGTDSSGAPTYTHGRLNVVYVGANDGFIHGFSAGSLDPYGNLVDDTTTPNTGYEVLAYMPSAVLQTIDNAKNSDSTTQPELDYPNTLYSHAWYVDATPGTGDLFYQCTSSTLANCQSGKGTWHTWLVGGLGAGGAGIYALDVTNPSSAYFKESNTAIVVGDWTPSNITCETPAGAANQTAACGSFLGNTYGTPLIRRFHNGSWGVIFGNGYNTSAGYAGIFIMLVDPSSGAKTFYYLPAGTATSSGNGIGPTTSADLDLDHIVDYIYAGDL
jgi:type IV pilus assembly protein PilY1